MSELLRMKARCRITLCWLACLTLTGIALPASASILGGLFGTTITGSGKFVKQVRETGHFTGISIAVPATVELRQGDVERVTIETDDNVLPEVETVVDGMTLKIRPLSANTSIATHALKILIEARKINLISLGGSGSVVASSLHSRNLKLMLGGAGVIKLAQLDADNVTLSLGGSGQMVLKGTAHELRGSIGGSGVIDAGGCSVRTAALSIGGSGNATVAPSETLRASLAGSGQIRYYGDPEVSQSVAGSGSVVRLGPISLAH